MKFKDLIKIRQSDRKYSTQKLEEEKVALCIEAARLSPSACNSQPWTFVVVDEPELKNQVAENCASLGMNKFTFQSPVIVAIVLEKMTLSAKMGSVIKDKEYSLMDIGIAANQFCLQAAELGLGTCMIGWFDEKKVKKLLSVPKKKRIPLLISLGYPDAKTREKIRKPMDEVCVWNKY